MIAFRILFLSLMLLPFASFASMSSDLVLQGRAFLEQQQLVQANDSFKQALAADASNQEANFLYAVTRLLNAVEANQNGPNSSKMDSIKELLDKLGISSQGRTIYNWTADFARDAEGDVILPATIPKSADIQEFVLNYVVPEIDGSLNNLSKIGADFNIYITPAMLAQSDNGLGGFGNTEIDYGDILLFKALLQLIKTSLYINTAYNTDIDFYDLYKKAKADTFKNINQLFAQYPKLLTIKRSANFAPAKESFKDAIDLYLEASDFIRKETDDQLDDLVSIDPADLAAEEDLRLTLSDIKLALDGPKDIRPESDKFRDPTGDFIRIDLTRLFDEPAALRNYIAFTANTPCIPADPTINGLLPYFTKYDWSDLGDDKIAVDLSWNVGTYYAGIFFEDHNKLASSVTANGPGITGTLNIPYVNEEDSWYKNIPLGPSMPLTPLMYDITIKDKYGSCTFEKQIYEYDGDYSYPPDVSVDPLVSSFNDVSVNNLSGEKDITISNTGTDMLYVHSINLPSEDFAMNIYGGDYPCGTTSPNILPGGKCTVSVKFGPHSTGPKNGSLAIVSDDPDEGTVYVSLTGTGISGEGNCFDDQDDDSDQLTDCKDPDCSGASGGSCSTGLKGICSAGILTCSSGKKQCIPINQPLQEGPAGDATCSDLSDNDCDGNADSKDIDCSNLILNVTTSGSGSGTVTGSPQGINCGTDCKESYLNITKVTLKATPAKNSVFSGWTSDCAGSDASAAIIVDGEKTCNAEFNLKSYDLKVKIKGNGKVSSDSMYINIDCGSGGQVCAGKYVHSSQITLVATDNMYGTFDKWTGCDKGSDLYAKTCTVTMDKAKTVTAAFKSNTLTVKKSGAGAKGGTVTSEPSGIDCGADCKEGYASNTAVTLTAADNDYAKFDKWIGDCNCTTKECQVTMDKAKNCTAAFTAYALKVTKSGSGLVTSDVSGIGCGKDCSEGYAPDMVVKLTAQADAGYEFIGWTGDVCSGANPYTITMDKPKNIKALFNKTGSSSLSYKGLTCQVTIDSGEKAKDILLGAFKGGRLGDIVSALLMSQSSASAQAASNTAGNFALNQSLQKVAGRIAASAESSKISAAATYSECFTEYGECGGSAYICVTASSSGSFIGTINFNNYCDMDVSISGSVGFSGKVNISAWKLQNISLKFEDVSAKSGVESSTITGSLSYNFASDPVAGLMNFLIRDDATMKVNKVENIKIYLYDKGSYIEAVESGKYYDPDYGYGEIFTTTPLRFDPYSGSFGPYSGVIECKGSSGTKAKLTAISSYRYRVEADTDGDGVFEYDSGALNWPAP